MKKIAKIAAGLGLATGAALLFNPALAGGRAKIPKAQAEQIALGKAPGGRIRSAELEHEKGALVWSFDITMPGTRDITEVLVNADTGAVVEVSKETPKQQHDEVLEDARAAAHARH